MSDYRPISLTTTIYKILAKVLADRLKTVLPNTIASAQSAFVQGRQITDSTLMANEMIDYWRCAKKKGVILKLDLEKAFDKLDWHFLLKVLSLKGFNSKWLAWICGCITSVSFSILLNGKPRGKISANRGIRQGDPLSPFLFVIAMDYLSQTLDAAYNKGLIEGFRIRDNGTHISHLLFADDILLLSSPDERKFRNLHLILKSFEQASGLNINLNKSSISGINVSHDELHYLAGIWSCPIQALPSSYLGMPLGGNPRSESFWAAIIERVDRKLEGWNYSHISKGGRLTLVQSVLSSLPTYYLSIFKPPAHVSKILERKMRNFLWEGMGEKGFSHLIRWDITTLPKELGGLGIGRINTINMSLLTKWFWRFSTHGPIYGRH